VIFTGLPKEAAGWSPGSKSVTVGVAGQPEAPFTYMYATPVLEELLPKPGDPTMAVVPDTAIDPPK
jgi:hypothetical protein